ncbi:hypothetical protein AXX17_AT3G32850 [Arabidopsis thaliana]|uniref:Uncharacterized protein n=1 Tax=Arabidopsis thaliana TaxID=3702 RepID=A0A178VJ12_ARATH|nr:hypothetical protein AXX17_AT3G32850 [Arabidopsis thaliana]
MEKCWIHGFSDFILLATEKLSTERRRFVKIFKNNREFQFRHIIPNAPTKCLLLFLTENFCFSYKSQSS